MKRLIPLITLATLTWSGVTKAAPLVVYGEDNRSEVVDAAKIWQEKAKSVAVRVAKFEMLTPISGPKKLAPRTLKETNTSIDSITGGEITFCEGTPFINQPNPATCTGFLVGPDLLLTAGHCVSSEQMCADFEWVFDFKTEKNGSVDMNLNPERTYSCKKIIRAMTPEQYGMDYSLIQLDRNVEGRASLEVNIADHIGKSDKVVMIGSPLGVPLKVSTEASVRDDDGLTTFSTNLDSFFGNSGSPVFNERTGKVEGILVNGEEDHKFNMKNMCIEINRCGDDECRGEEASRIATIPELALRDSIHLAASVGNLEFFEQLEEMKVNLFVDIYGPDKVTPLMVALKHKQLSIASKLIKLGASPTHKSLDGKTPFDIASQILEVELRKEALELLKAK